MTSRLAMAVALLLVLLAQAWGLVSVLRDDPLRNLTVKGKKAAPAAMVPGMQSLQPTVPVDPPDLNQGYLFSAERSLTGGGKSSKSQNAANVAIDKIQYSGSIITATNPKALLSYSLGGPAGSPDGGAGARKQGFLRVAVGDTVNGYTVTEILPEKIIFSRDGQQITKLLYDKGKAKGQGATSPSTREQTGRIPAAVPVIPGAYVTESQRIPIPRKLLQSPPLPSDEELRKKPLRKRLEPPSE